MTRLSERLATDSPWREAVEKRLEVSRGWDLTLRENRAEVRQLHRRLFWAKYGVYRAAAIGVTIGVLVNLFVAFPLLKMISGGF